MLQYKKLFLIACIICYIINEFFYLFMKADFKGIVHMSYNDIIQLALRVLSEDNGLEWQATNSLLLL